MIAYRICLKLCIYEIISIFSIHGLIGIQVLNKTRIDYIKTFKHIYICSDDISTNFVFANTIVRGFVPRLIIGSSYKGPPLPARASGDRAYVLLHTQMRETCVLISSLH